MEDTPPSQNQRRDAFKGPVTYVDARRFDVMEVKCQEINVRTA